MISEGSVVQALMTAVFYKMVCFMVSFPSVSCKFFHKKEYLLLLPPHSSS